MNNVTTKTKEELINEVKNHYAREYAEIDKRRNYRMKNYYDCVDDYSWGGICDVADDMLERRLVKEEEISIEMIKNGGFFTRTCIHSVLVNENGEIVSNKILSGPYGWFFHVKDGDNEYNVGVAKRQSTYAKRGLKMMNMTSEYNITWHNGNYFKDGNLKYDTITLVNSSMTESTEPALLNDIESQYEWKQE